ncbi:hypothetical protein MKJ04_11025 [Pontibacter sp. E15-1]|uniref:hypothetical protein n=1 Tax=Pontibacter sp. E15-1 TaxID=2919918 RepID=UPI001F4F9410|nr:hypothetical protein [Pontibacter sp. E15-1]MCJ8165375.1 hypothetical protein [Pontibacter sp. E15-1]
MKNIAKIIGAICLLWTSSHAMAQDTKPSLDAAPAPVLTDMPASRVAAQAAEADTKEKPAWTGPRLSYSLATGMSFSSGYGSSQFITPSVRYQVSSRFRVTAGLTYQNFSAYTTNATTPEGTTVLYRNGGGSQYLASVGVDYLATDRLILSGNIWRDFSNMPAQSLHYNGLYSPGRMGADLRATYKITDNLSVTGGLRYTNGASPYGNPYYNSGFGSYGPGGFGY